MNTPYYRDYSAFLKEIFPYKVQKLTVDAGFSCPNRDGVKGRGGCIYCNNSSFSPSLNKKHDSVKEQLEKGKNFFGKKYKDLKYLAYFQSYTNTYDLPERLISIYKEAISVENISGLIIGTRPDCISRKLLELLLQINISHPVIMEYGAESSHDETLDRVNRCHTWQDTVNAVRMTKEVGLRVGLHFILGLPGETKDMIFQTVDRIHELDVDVVKFHQLQIIKGTKLAKDYDLGHTDLKLFELNEYLELCCEIIGKIKPSIALERFTSSSPDDLLIAPKWGIKNYQFVNLLNNTLREKGIKQGCFLRDGSTTNNL